MHGMIWFNTSTVPQRRGYVQRMIPVIHNYSLWTAMEGKIADRTYVAPYGNPSYRSYSDMFQEDGFYVYPAMFKKTIYTSVTMSLAETDYIQFKPQTRWALPILTTNTGVAPGSEAVGYLISDDVMHNRVIRLGVKRGPVRAVLEEATYETVKSCSPTSPFNVSSSNVKEYMTLLKHPAGDVGLMGEAEMCLRSKVGSGREAREDLLVVPNFLEI
jgi:hypothetical protein